MISTRQPLRIAALFFCVLLSAAAHAAPQLAISPLGYQVTQIVPVPRSPRTFDITSRAGVINLGDRATAVQAMLMSSSSSFVVLDGAVSFGDVPRTPPLRPVISQDTFKLRITLPPRRDLRELIQFIQSIHQSLSWQVSCGNCGVNRPPVANAGADQTVYATQTVTLDGSASTDPDGQALTYQWSFVSRPAGSTAALSSTTAVKPTFVPDRDGNYVVQLIVKDGQLSSSPDTVEISTLNSAPVANAGADQAALTGQAVALDGSASSDIDGDSLTYAWSIVTAPAGSQASIANPAQVKPTFTPDLAGPYTIELIVDDGTVPSAPDTMIITTTRQNGQPVANAGPDQTVHVGDTAHLDGTASSDPDSDPLTYRWSLNARPTNSNTGLQGATSPSPTLAIDKPGTYVAQLIVSDGAADSSPDTVSLSTTNSAPVASASAPASVHWNTTVQVDGSASTDVDGDALGFTWSILSRPAGSQAAISDPSAIKPTFQADRPGVYVVQLVVNDGHVNSAPASASVSATNQAPVAHDESASTNTNVGVDISVLANDSDADGDMLSIGSVSTPAHGIATVNGNSVHYTPAAGFSGNDSFTYAATDGADSASATVTITVTAATANHPPLANAGPDQTVAGGSEVLLDGSLSSDPDGDSLSFVWVLQSIPANSSPTLSDANTAAPRFTADRRGVYVASLTVTDGRGGSTSDTVSVTALNRNPTAVADNATTAMNGAISIDVLANDTDPDGNVLTISTVTQPPNGAAEIQGTSIRFTPATGFSGATSFNYTIGDGNGGTATALVSVNVTPAALPELSIDDVSVTEGDAGTTTVAFTVTQSAPSASSTTVSYATADDTAVAPGDYVAASGTAVIAAGSTSTDITVTINGDTLAESNESLLVRLSNPINATTADDEGVAEIVDDDAGAPTSVDLIEQALAGGQIDDETALIYEVFAEFQDARLPAQYHGRDAAFFEGVALREAARRFAMLTPATQTTLAPFLEFPDLFALPVSTAQPAAARQTLGKSQARFTTATTTASYSVLELLPGKVRMAWDANSPLAAVLEAKANALKTEFNARIWPKLTTFLGPLTAGQIQILLSDVPGQPGEEFSTDCTTAKITLHRYDPWVFAHELTHALLDLNFAISACNDAEKLWMHEATATWAQHYVYPPANQGKEQGFAPLLLRATERSLSAYARGTAGHQYGAYLWFFRLAGQENNPGIVRAIWQAGAGVTSLDAIESVLRASGFGGFNEQWPKFALDNWNREAPDGPYRKYYQWDKLDHKASQAEYTANLNGAGWQVVPLAYDLPFLSASYQRWDFTHDQHIRGILFRNSDAGNSPNTSIQAIIKVKGQPWRAAEDWSAEKEKFFCRDLAEEDVEQVVLVVANRGFHPGDPHIKDNGNFTLYYSALPCSDWTGSTTYRDDTPPLPGGVSLTTAAGELLRFHIDLTQSRAVWRAVEGTVTAHYTSTTPFEDGTCTATANKVFDAKDHAQFELIPQPNNTLAFTGGYIAFTSTPPTISQTVSCSSSSGSFTFTQDVPYYGTAWFSTGPNLWPFPPGTTTLQDSYPNVVVEAQQRWTWNLTKVQ